MTNQFFPVKCWTALRAACVEALLTAFPVFAFFPFSFNTRSPTDLLSEFSSCQSWIQSGGPELSFPLKCIEQLFLCHCTTCQMAIWWVR